MSLIQSSQPRTYTAIGLMSGTSMDGIDAALIKTDGKNIISRDYFEYYPYSESTKNKIRNLIANPDPKSKEAADLSEEITNQHIFAVQSFVKKHQLMVAEIDIIGFHGHTILHAPERKITWQIGDGQKLATETKINVVANFRIKDVELGGQGAPLVPIYHHSLFKSHPQPLVILNIGGVSNITYIEDQDENNLIACDVCFGNAPLDDLVKNQIGKNFDEGGKLATSGKVNQDLAKEFLAESYFQKPSPKSLDRNQFSILLRKFTQIKLEESLATLVFILAKALESAINQLPQRPKEIIVCGGGRKNLAIMRNIEQVTRIKVTNIDDLKINGQKIDGDAIEAEAFAFLAVRNLLNLPISYQKTSGVLLGKHAVQTSKGELLSSCGGVFYRA